MVDPVVVGVGPDVDARGTRSLAAVAVVAAADALREGFGGCLEFFRRRRRRRGGRRGGNRGGRLAPLPPGSRPPVRRAALEGRGDRAGAVVVVGGVGRRRGLLFARNPLVDGGGPGSLGGLVSRAFLVLAVDRRGGRDARRDRGVRRAILADVARGGAARGGDRARRGSLGGAHQRRGLRPRVSRVGRGDHLGVGDRDPATAAGLPGVVVVVGGGGGLGVKAPLGLGGACGVERWELSRVQVRGLARRGGRGARSPRVNVVVVLVHARAPAGLVEALGGVGRAIAPRLGRHGGGRRDDASGSRGISPPSPRGAVCGSWRARLFPET